MLSLEVSGPRRPGRAAADDLLRSGHLDDSPTTDVTGAATADDTPAIPLADDDPLPSPVAASSPVTTGETTPSSSNGAGQRGRRRLRALKAENRKLKQRNKCRLCQVRAPTLTLLPCGHFLLCEQCGDAHIYCPACRNRVLATVKTFFF